MPPAAGVVVVGSLNADLTITTDRLPSAGETVAGHTFTTRPGGKGANQAVAAARLGTAVTLIGCVGQDEHGQLLRHAAAEDGIDTTPVVALADTTTGVAVIEVDAHGENSIVVYPGANGRLTPEHVEQAAHHFTSASVICLCLEIPVETVTAAARLGHNNGAGVVLNLSPFRTVPADLLTATDLLLVNEHEARQLLDAADRTLDWQSSIQGFKECGVRNVIVTLGAKGSMVIQGCTDDHPVVTPVPAVPTRVVDTTGCGDAFTGAVAHALASGEDLLTAANQAALVASMAAAVQGAQASYPTLREVRRL